MTSEVGSPAQSTVLGYMYSNTLTRKLYDIAGLLLQDLVLLDSDNNNFGAIPYTSIVRTAETPIPVF
jgi:hypothetical protein